MVKVTVTKKDGTTSSMFCRSIEVKGCCILSNNSNDPIQLLINTNNVEKVEVEAYD